jgi:endonuclease V-like protein UPF0215 family
LHPCYLGIDDGYFDVSFKRSNTKYRTVLVGAIVCDRNFVDLYIDFVTVDGLDATTASYRIIEKALNLYDIEAVLLDGVTYAGFNIVNPKKLYILTLTPMIVIFRHKLDLEKIRNALEKHFPDHLYRYSVIEETYMKSTDLFLEYIPTTIRVYSVGIQINKAKEIIQKLCNVFVDPYPLRIADKVASTLGRIIMKKYLERGYFRSCRSVLIDLNR